MNTDKTGIECVNEVYKAIGYADVLPYTSIHGVADDLFDIVGDKNEYTLKKDSYCKKMLLPSYCYAGRRIRCESSFEEKLARMVRPEYLMTGDVIISVKSRENNFYLCAGEKILNLTKKEYVEDTVKFTETILATDEYFAILRPSLAR